VAICPFAAPPAVSPRLTAHPVYSPTAAVQGGGPRLSVCSTSALALRTFATATLLQLLVSSFPSPHPCRLRLPADPGHTCTLPAALPKPPTSPFSSS
jgi:hypothetical protein